MMMPRGGLAVEVTLPHNARGPEDRPAARNALPILHPFLRGGAGTPHVDALRRDRKWVRLVKYL
jgi:hypothetical protein